MLGYKELIRKYKINNLVETEHIIEKQRMIKDQEEISSLEKACEITDNCFQYILTYIKPGMTERQIADEIEEYYKKRTEGLEGEPFVEITKDPKYKYATFYKYRRLSDNYEYFNYDVVIESYINRYYEISNPIKMSDGRYCYHEHGDVNAFKVNKKGQLMCKYCENVIPRKDKYINVD